MQDLRVDVSDTDKAQTSSAVGSSWLGLNAWLRRLRTLSLVMLPTVTCILYFSLMASDRYVSEAQFLIRTAGRPMSTGSWGALLQMTGLARAGDEAYSVQSFVNSREAVVQLSQKLPLAEIYSRPGADFLTRYPNIVYGSTIDEMHRYLGWMIRSSHSSTTGLTTLSVQAFRPEDAKAILDTLLRLGEERVNQMNARIREDAVRASTREVQEFEQKLINSQVALTQFRNAELLIDPAASAIMTSDLIGRLSDEATRIEAQSRETSMTAPNSPAFGALKSRLAALEDQIRKERTKIADPTGGLASRLAQYERLALDREFAKTALAAAVKGLEQAQTEARRQQLYVQMVVNPSLPEYPMMPQKLRMTWTVFALNMIGLLVGWLLYSGISQHRAGH